MTQFQAPTGTRDVLAPESARYERLVSIFARCARLAGYGLVLSPMFEDLGVFNRGIGATSEIVTKEMYEFEDKGGRHLALRPEGTASIVRAYVQHRPQIPWKAWYVTPAFRYERPQAGRFRQHHQVGIEAIGSDDPDLDVEVVALLDAFLRGVGLQRITLRINSMGDTTCRPDYERALGSYLEQHSDRLCDEHRATWQRNALRVLDCKRPECESVREGAPLLRDALCGDCSVHFDRVLAGLDALSIAYVRDDFLVRGFDYYTRTTFEYVSEALDSAQNAVGGGGRYDGLVELLGGPRTPGIGFGSGIERVLLAAQSEGLFKDEPGSAGVFVIDMVGGDQARDLTQELRAAGIAADRAFDQRSLKAQLRAADRSGARIALIIGEDEKRAEAVTAKMLREKDAHHQELIPRAQLLLRLGELLSR